MDQVNHAPAGPNTETGLSALLAPALDPLFWRPGRIDVASAWHGHIPFAYWIVRAAAPRVFVELGTHAGVSYAAFCNAVVRERLCTRCFAVDTWQGDEHAGFYGEEIFADLSKFHDRFYGAFSRLLRCTFDEALAYIADGTVDLLHVDGRHHYEDVRHDFETWVPKLSPRSVVLFHDTNVREREFGVWRLWAELSARHPSFEFLHEHGLGVLAFGPEVPEPVAALCRLQEPAAIAALRERFALLGERWSHESVIRRQERDAAARSAVEASLRATVKQEHWQVRQATARAIVAEADARAAQARAAEFEARARDAEGQSLAGKAATTQLEARAQAMQRQLEQAEQQLSAARQRIEQLEADRTALRHDREILLASTSWRVTRPMRIAVGLLSGRPPEPSPGRICGGGLLKMTMFVHGTTGQLVGGASVMMVSTGGTSVGFHDRIGPMGNGGSGNIGSWIEASTMTAESAWIWYVSPAVTRKVRRSRMRQWQPQLVLS